MPGGGPPCPSTLSLTRSEPPLSPEEEGRAGELVANAKDCLGGKGRPSELLNFFLEALRLFEPSLIPIENRQIVETRRNIRVVGGKRGFVNRQRFLIERFRFLQPSLSLIETRQVVETRRNIRVVGGK